MRLCAICALLALAASPGLAVDPVTINPGDPRVDGSIIRPYHNSWRLLGRGPDGSVVEMGTWTDDARIGTVNGREAIIRRQIWVHSRGSEGYFNVVDHRTLAPIVSQYTNAGGLYYRMEYSADGRTVRYQRSPQPQAGEGNPTQRPLSASMEQGQVQIPAPFFDFNSGMFGLLIAGFPLREGLTARFPNFRSYDPRAEPAWVDFEVRGRETVPAGPGRTLDTWLVVAHSPDTDEVMTFNLIKEPPYIIRLRQPWQGRDWTFEMM